MTVPGDKLDKATAVLVGIHNNYLIFIFIMCVRVIYGWIP